MIPMAPQQMGTPPVAARRGRDVRHGRRAVVTIPATVALCSARHRAARHPYAGIPATGLDRNGNGMFVSGFWAPGSMVAGTTLTIKRPTRHLVPRTT